MATLPERAFAGEAKLPEAEQEVLTARLLAELAEGDDFDWAILGSAGKPPRLETEVIAEHRAGLTEERGPHRP